MDRFRLPNTVDIHLPSVLVGRMLPWSKEKNKFDVIKDDIEIYFSDSIDLKKLLKVVDDIDQTEAMGFTQSMKLLAHVMSYLRIKLLSRDVMIVEMAAVLLDFLVKNCHYRIHIYVSRKMFMKTFCLVLRQLLADERTKHHATGMRMLDMLQGWGEAFKIHRREIYPYVIASYEKTRHKYGIKYPRSDFDPTRVPIFLDEINRHEINEAIKSKSRLGIFTSPRDRKSNDTHIDRMEESKIGSTYSFDSVSSSIVSDKDSELDSDMISFTDKENATPSSSAVQNVQNSTANDMMTNEKSFKTTSNLPQSVDSKTENIERELIEFDVRINSIGYLDLNDTTQSTDVPHKESQLLLPPTQTAPDASWLVDFSDSDLLILPNAENALDTATTTTTTTATTLIASSCNTNVKGYAAHVIPITPPPVLTIKTTDVTKATDPHSALIGSILASYSAPINSDADIPTSLSGIRNTPHNQPNANSVSTPLYSATTPNTPTLQYGGITRGIVTPKESDNGDRLLNLLNLDVKQMLSTMKEKGPETKSARSVPLTPITSLCPPPTPTPSTPALLVKPSETGITKTTIPTKFGPNTPPIIPPRLDIKKQEIINKQEVKQIVKTAPQSPIVNLTRLPEQSIAEGSRTDILESTTIPMKIVKAEKIDIVKNNLEVVYSKPESEEQNDDKIQSATTPLSVLSPPLSICTSHNKSISKLLEENECVDTPQTVDLHYALDSRKQKNAEHQNHNNTTLESLILDSCDSADNGQVTDIDQRRRRRSNSYAPPSSDSTVEVRYFGHQRVVIKKK